MRLSFNAPKWHGESTCACTYLLGYHGSHRTWLLRAVMQQIWTWFVALQLLLTPKSWWGEKFDGVGKKTARNFIFCKCGEMESSLLFNPDQLVPNHRNQYKIEESWRDGRISREFCLKLWALVDSWKAEEEEEGRRRKEGKEGRKKL